MLLQWGGDGWVLYAVGPDSQGPCMPPRLALLSEQSKASLCFSDSRESRFAFSFLFVVWYTFPLLPGVLRCLLFPSRDISSFAFGRQMLESHGAGVAVLWV